MTKKIVSYISLTLSLCMLFSTTVFAAEPGSISNMTYIKLDTNAVVWEDIVVWM